MYRERKLIRPMSQIDNFQFLIENTAVLMAVAQGRHRWQGHLRPDANGLGQKDTCPGLAPVMFANLVANPFSAAKNKDLQT